MFYFMSVHTEVILDTHKRKQPYIIILHKLTHRTMNSQHNNRIYISIIQNTEDRKQQTKLLLQESPELLDVSSTEGAGRDIAIGATRELMQKLIAPFNKDLHLGAPGGKNEEKTTTLKLPSLSQLLSSSSALNYLK